MIKIKIRQKLRDWLFREEIGDLNNAKEVLHKTERLMDLYNEKLTLSIDNACQSQKLADDTRKLVNSICEVGADINLRTREDSWAVVCIHGKMDYVKFIPMRQDNIREISHFLKQFEYSNRTLDTPMKYDIEDCLMHW